MYLRYSWLNLGQLGLLLSLIMLMSNCSKPPQNNTAQQATARAITGQQSLSTTATSPAIIATGQQPTSSAISNIEVSVLDNLKANGFDSNPNINNGLGGLLINWRYGTNPLQINVNGTGEPDDASINPPRHDPLTEIRYIHNLWSYKHEKPSDTHYDSEIARYTPVIKAEFTDSHNERGWLFDEFIAVYNLSNDAFYKKTAYSLASSYANAFNPTIGSIYKKNSSHPNGTYRIEDALEAGCALVQASVLFNKPEWMQKGMSTINFVYAHGYVVQYHTFASQMDNVLLPDGSVNPHQTFLSGTTNNAVVSGANIQIGPVAQIAISLLDAYKVTHNQDFLNKATGLLDSYTLPTNSLGMWDTTNGGYYFSVNFKGSSPADVTGFTLNKAHKETGRQIIMLQAFHMANQLTGGKYKSTEDQLLSLAMNKVYYTPGHGVLYEVNSDWSLRKFHNGTYDNMVTTEAMGAELESLFSLSQ